MLRHHYSLVMLSLNTLLSRFIHRLDYATSGCLCVALTKAASRWGNKAFAQRYVTKYYVALVCWHYYL